MRKLVIVARRHQDLYHYLRNRFADAPETEVLLDRRLRERRGEAVAVASERRSGDRRARPELDALLLSRSHVIVTVPQLSP